MILIRIINCITAPIAEKLLNGKKLSDVRHIGYLPEERGFTKMKVGEQAVLGSTQRDDQA